MDKDENKPLEQASDPAVVEHSGGSQTDQTSENTTIEKQEPPQALSETDTDSPDTSSGDATPTTKQKNQEQSSADSSVTAADKPKVETSKNVDLVSGSDAESMKFADFGLQKELIEATEKRGWAHPTPVQAMCLPVALKQRNLAGFAQTGTGKTGVFLITLGDRILKLSAEGIKTQPHKPIAIVVVPTRELAVQIQQEAEELLGQFGIKSMAVYGGADWEKQGAEFDQPVDIVIATPGRFRDFHGKDVISLEECQIFVCDEADRMFDMGFIRDIEYFLEHIPEHSQKLLFSATTSEDVKELVFKYVDNPEYLSVSPDSITPENIDQHAWMCEATDKIKVLIGLLREEDPECVMIFANTKVVCEWLQHKLSNNGFDVDMITGDLPQKKRIRLIERVKNSEVKALICTDVASRGLHISGVTHVINFDIPDDPANYVHRVGRTARGGKKGKSYSLICEDYGQNMIAVNALLAHAAPQAEWPEKRFLETEDTSDNPFEKPARRARAPRTGDHDSRGSHRRGRGRQNQEDSSAGRHRPTRHETAKRTRPYDREERDSRESKRRSHHKGGQKASQRVDSGNTRRKRGAGGQRTAVKRTEKTTLFGLIKKLWQTFFGAPKKVVKKKKVHRRPRRK